MSREELLVAAHSSAELEFEWTPGAEGLIREAVELRVDHRYSLGLFLIGTAAALKKVCQRSIGLVLYFASAKL